MLTFLPQIPRGLDRAEYLLHGSCRCGARGWDLESCFVGDTQRTRPSSRCVPGPIDSSSSLSMARSSSKSCSTRLEATVYHRPRDERAAASQTHSTDEPIDIEGEGLSATPPIPDPTSWERPSLLAPRDPYENTIDDDEDEVNAPPAPAVTVAALYGHAETAFFGLDKSFLNEDSSRWISFLPATLSIADERTKFRSLIV